MQAARELAVDVGAAPACQALGVSRATFYRRQAPPRTAVAAEAAAARPSPRALTGEERQAVLDILHEERFIDRAPAAVYAQLLDENRYLCSIRTMYRLLADAQEVRERRDQLRHPTYRKPELLATAPNQKFVLMPMEASGVIGSIAGIAELAKEALGKQQVETRARIDARRAGG